LSITHHTRKRRSTGPRTTHGPQVLHSLSFQVFSEVPISEVRSPVTNDYLWYSKSGENYVVEHFLRAASI
jgi:hypothetical protein